MSKSGKSKVGIWIAGARGGVASTAILGLSALKSGKVGTVGLVTENADFKGANFPAWSDFVVGGCEIRNGSIYDTVSELGGVQPAINSELIRGCKRDLTAVDSRLGLGTLRGSGDKIRSLSDLPVPFEETAQATVDRLQSQMDEFVQTNRLDRLIVVNLTSTEPASSTVQEITALNDSEGEAAMLKAWDKAIARKCADRSPASLPASTLYAYAAMTRGWTFINFTPSSGAPLPLARIWADQYGASFMGCDGKTGETLMKSVLAPMFRYRNLNVMSWVGHNIFGNLDGVVLDDPANKATKVHSKDHLLGEILGYRPQTLVSIEYIQSLGDWKTAWDHIHFQGFLGTPMTLQFTWQGCDSILAAPLVLDMVRLAETAARRGQHGHLDFLASFFKSPQGATTHDFAKQYLALYDWIMKQ